jgi:hypothetical protein
MYVDPGFKDEAYCIVCGYAEYRETISEKFLPNPFEKTLEYEVA